MATNFYTFYAIKSESKILELCQSRKEANDSKPFWVGRKGLKIEKMTIEAVCLAGKIFLPITLAPEYPMWLKEPLHKVEYAVNLS